jgi:hypothetical protein
VWQMVQSSKNYLSVVYSYPSGAKNFGARGLFIGTNDGQGASASGCDIGANALAELLMQILSEASPLLVSDSSARLEGAALMKELESKATSTNYARQLHRMCASAALCLVALAPSAPDAVFMAISTKQQSHWAHFSRHPGSYDVLRALDSVQRWECSSGTYPCSTALYSLLSWAVSHAERRRSRVHLRTAFRLFDADDSGAISCDEFEKVASLILTLCCISSANCVGDSVIRVWLIPPCCPSIVGPVRHFR